MDAIKTLIDRYQLTDPVGTNVEGVFTNQILQKMYDNFVEVGSKSNRDALQVGTLIEEVDIKDLDEQLKLVEDGSDIAFVYQNLRRGSVKHLNAFNRNLDRLP